MLAEELEASRPSGNRRLVQIQPKTRNNGVVYADVLEDIPGIDAIGRSSQSSELSPMPTFADVLEFIPGIDTISRSSQSSELSPMTVETSEIPVQTSDEHIDRELIWIIRTLVELMSRARVGVEADRSGSPRVGS
jgi:hypothetical protein